MGLYRSVEAALVRVAAHPDTWEPPPLPEVCGDARADADHWRPWIEQVWAETQVADAVQVASPSLAHRVHAICAGHRRAAKQVCQVGNALARYVLRQRHRATPFGLFAGVAPARIGAAIDVKWGIEHHAVARADAAWLAAVIERLEACPQLLRRLTVVTDSTGFVRGDRLVIGCQQPPHDGQRAPGELTVRCSRAVRAAVSAARSPVTIAELAGRLAARFPGTPPATIDGLLAGLVANRVLLTSLRPAMTVTDALGHVIDQLDAVNADGIASVAPTVTSLRAVHATLARHPEADPETRRHLREHATGRMTALAAVEQPLAVDLRLDCSLTLPGQVVREAETAAGVLAHLAPFPSGSPAWWDYHARFLERYGTNALVPLLQLTDPDIGLGFPVGYRGAPPRPGPALTARDERLLGLAQHAAVDGVREVVLSDQLVTELSQGARLGQVPHIDLCFRLHALTRDAVDRGGFTVHVVGLAPTAGATAGRFLALLDPAGRDRMTELYTSLPPLDGQAVRAQLSSPPLQVRTENVARVPALWPDVISVAEHRASSLALADLAVGADETGLYLVSLPTRRRVEPVALNAVDLVHVTHPLARLLCELPRAHVPSIGPFHWGVAANLPFLPRIRYRRCVLSPATWRLTAADLAGTAATLGRWHETLTAWRTRFGVPDAVQVGDGDQRLHLRLDYSADAQMLRAHLDQIGHATLREAPEPSDYGWFDGRAHEITLALAATRTETPPGPATEGPSFPVVVGRDHGDLPGQPGTALVNVYGHPDRQPEVLEQLCAVLDRGVRSWPWWFVRGGGPQPHLRVWVRLAGPDAFAQVAARVSAWAATLRRLGLLGRIQWDTAYPQTSRYGTGAASVAVEAVFAADSAAAIAQLALAAGADTPLEAVTAASLFDLATSLLGDVRTAAQWLTDQPAPDTTTHPDRPTYQAAMRLAGPDHGPAAIRELPGGERLLAAWARRRDALRAYCEHLTGSGQPAPQTVLRSLLALHRQRVHGPDDERACDRLARSAALAWVASTAGVSP